MSKGSKLQKKVPNLSARTARSEIAKVTSRLMETRSSLLANRSPAAVKASFLRFAHVGAELAMAGIERHGDLKRVGTDAMYGAIWAGACFAADYCGLTQTEYADWLHEQARWLHQQRLVG